MRTETVLPAFSSRSSARWTTLGTSVPPGVYGASVGGSAGSGHRVHVAIRRAATEYGHGGGLSKTVERNDQRDSQGNRRPCDARSTRGRYEAVQAACVACPVKDKCTRGRARSVHISPDIRRHRQATLANLASPVGVRMRSLRGVEVQTPFAVQKHAYRFQRYHLRGVAGARIESGLFLSAFNLRRPHAVFLRYMTTGARPALRIAPG